MDIASRQLFPKGELLRLVCKDGVLVLDLQGDLPGRGFYLHKSQESFDLAKRKKVFERLLHRPLREEEEASIKEALS